MKESILKNGMRIVTKADKNSKICTLSYLINAGSYDESDNERGIAHLVEHLLFKGTLNRTYSEINKNIESVGGYLNAETSFQHTRYYCTVPYDYWDIGLDVLSDLIFNNTIPEDEFYKEKKVVQEELKMYNDDHSSFVMDKLFEELFEGYENRKSIGGTVSSIEKIERDDVINFITENYFPKNMTIIANGNVNHDEIVRFIENYLNKIDINFVDYQKNYDKFDRYKLNNKIKKFKRSEIEQTYLAFGMFGPAYDDKDIYAVQVLTTILGGNSTSRLFDIIREQKGLAYTINMNIETISDTSIIHGYAGLNNEYKTEDIINSISDVILNIKNDITAQEIEEAKSYMIGMLYLQVEKTSGMNSFLSEKVLYNADCSLENEIEKINNVTYEQVINVIEKYILKENLLFILLGK